MSNWVVCLKHGTKYSSEYVNRLFNMCKRHITVPFNFACITENSSGIDPSIKIIPVPQIAVTGWWYKPWVFSDEIPIDGTILFLDLDIVIINNIDMIWSYHPEKFCIIRDFNRSTIKEWNKFNSSIFKFQKGNFSFVWNNFIKDTSITRRLHGDQDWIFNQVKRNFSFWPDEWMQSYKWEIRNRQDIIKVGIKRQFKDIVNPKIDPRTKILVFHGDPKPDEVKDPIVVDNWR